MRAEKRYVTLFAAMAALVVLFCGGAWAQSGVTMKTGTLPDGAAYLIEVPSNWNGVLFLYSHGYVVPGSANPATDVGDPATRVFMLSSGLALAGSRNTQVDYRRQFERSADAAEVRALYEQAGLDLEADRKMPNETTRISAGRQATAYLERNIIYDGDIHIPVLTLHTTGDGLVVVENESAYKQVVWEDGNGEFLRRTFEARAALHLHAGGNHRRRANAVGSLGNGKMARSGHFDFEYGSTLNGTGFYGLEHGLQS